jgi:SAM-dependent methyltransferase
MLEQGQRLATTDGLRNIAFLLGNATSLPWIDHQFDLVVCRFTLHQVADPAAVVREMVRVTRPTGRIGITDIIADGNPLVAAETNRLEHLRDPSHGRTLTASEVHALLIDAGASIAATVRRDNRLDLEDWMSRTQTPPVTPRLTRAVFPSTRAMLASAPSAGSPPRRRRLLTSRAASLPVAFVVPMPAGVHVQRRAAL